MFKGCSDCPEETCLDCSCYNHEGDYLVDGLSFEDCISEGYWWIEQCIDDISGREYCEVCRTPCRIKCPPGYSSEESHCYNSEYLNRSECLSSGEEWIVVCRAK